MLRQGKAIYLHQRLVGAECVSATPSVRGHGTTARESGKK